MHKHLLVFLLLAPGLAAAAEPSRIEHAFQGAAGVAVSANYIKDFAPERPDLYKHVIAGGAISSVLGSLANDRLGLTAGVVVAAGKELVNDALLGHGHPQLDDFAVTAASAIFCGRLSSDFAPMVFVDGHGVDLQFRCRF